jgi:hypothetical protein
MSPNFDGNVLPMTYKCRKLKQLYIAKIVQKAESLLAVHMS